MAKKISLKKAEELSKNYLSKGFVAFPEDLQNLYLDYSEFPEGPSKIYFYHDNYQSHMIERWEDGAEVTRFETEPEIIREFCRGDNQKQIAAGTYGRPKIDYEKHSDHEYVDLGLPSGMKWAKSFHFMGFSWGEVIKDKYSRAKKNVEKRSNATSIKADASMDAARYNWGGKWHMPTVADYQELFDNCTWRYRKYGYIITGPNGNTLFLPTSRWNDYQPYPLWTSDSPLGEDKATALFLKEDGHEFSDSSTKNQFEIWPVFHESDEESKVDENGINPEDYKKGIVKENGTLIDRYIYEGSRNWSTGNRVTAQRKIKTGDIVRLTFLGASEEEISVREWNGVWEMDETITVMGENFYFEVVVNEKNAYNGKYATYRYTKASDTMGGGVRLTVTRTQITEDDARKAFENFKEWLADGAKENNYWHGLYKKTEFPEKIAYGMPGEENVVPVAETTWKTGEVIEEGDGVFTFDGIRYELFDDYVYEDDKRKKVSVLKVLPLKGGEKYSGVVSIPETVKYRRRSRTVTEIDNKAFDDCPELTELNLPKTISSFGSISGSHKLKSVVVAEGNPDYISVDGVVYSRWYGKKGEYPKLVCYPSAHGEHFVFPDFVDDMKDGAFSGCQMLKSVVLSNKVRSIPKGAFGNCTNLESIIWGTGLESIWDKAFENCISLKSIVFPESVGKVDSRAFKGCTNISSITFAKGKYFDLDSLPRNLFPWGKDAFVLDGVRYAPIHEYDREDEALLAVVDFPKEEVEANVNAIVKEVIIPAHIERYGIEYEVYKCECSFNYLPSLKRLKLPVTVRKVNIAKMETLQEVVVDDANPDYSTMDGMLLNKDKTCLLAVPRGREDKKLVVPDGIEVIKENACSHHTHIEELIIPDSTTSIEKEAFNSCSSLHVVHLGNSVQKIGAASFAYTAIERVVLPPSARFVSPQYAWYGDSPFYASRLKAFELDGEHELYTVIDGVLYIKMQQAIGTICVSREESLNLKLRFCPPAFEGHLQIPEGVTDIIGCACSGCTELKSVFIPDGIDVIGDNAFCDCKKLERVEIDGHVNKIGSHCFWGCTSLKEIDCIGVKQIEDTAFRGIKGLKLNLPYALECKRSEIEKFIGE